MKDFTPYPLNPSWGKKVGAIMTLAALTLLVFTKMNIELLPGLSQRHQLEIWGWLLAFGLIFIALSKEPIDDERVEKIRASSFRIAFTLIIILMASFAGGSNLIEPGKVVFDPLLTIIFICAIYIIAFYIGLYTNTSLYFTDNDAGENYRKNRRFILWYVLTVTALTAIFFILILL